IQLILFVFKDTSVLGDAQGIDKKYISSDGKTFAMIYFDQTNGKSGGIETIQTPNNFGNLKIIEEVEKTLNMEMKIVYLLDHQLNLTTMEKIF
ncbi:hypothetical protein OLT30_01300, partial [Campylobacter jejuni]|nr:hypothetical protein [Campylobacter jejuni]